MQLKGGQQVSLTPGQTFDEVPDDVHVVNGTQRYQSGESPGVLDQRQGAPALVPVEGLLDGTAGQDP